MRTLLILCLCAPAWAASFSITAARINGTTTATASACHTANACNGWVLELDTSSSVATGGTYNLGFSQSSNNTPASSKVVLTVTSTGYKDCSGTTTTTTRTVYAEHQLREPYSNQAVNDETNSGGTMTFRLALSDVIYSGDTVTVKVLSSFYTDGSGNTLNALSSTAATNNSTLAYSTARTIANWSWPGWQRITGSTFTVRAVAFQRHAMNGLPVACVAFTATDQHSHTVTVNVPYPTVDPVMKANYDHGAVTEYIGNISTGTFTAKDLVTVNFKAYPWVGDSTAVLNSGDGTYAQPTSLYAPQYYLMDAAGTYGTAAAYVDGSANVTGSVTSGTFTAGEKLKQGTSNAIAYLISVPGGSGPMHIGAIVSGTPDSTHTWVGQSSAAVFTPTATPAYVGVDTNSCAVAEASWNPGSPPSPCRTINGAVVKMAAFNNTNSSRNDPAGTMYLAAGYYNWMGSSAAQPTTTGNVWSTITPMPGVSRSQVVIQNFTSGDQQGMGDGNVCTSGTTACGTPVHLKNVTVNVQTSPVSVFNTITYLWLDQDSVTIPNATAPIYNVTCIYATGGSVSNLAGSGLVPFSTTDTQYTLIRGVDLTGSTGYFVYTALANANSTITGDLEGTNEGYSGIPASVEPIFAFNTLYRLSPTSSPALSLTYTLNSMLGAAVVENIFEDDKASASELLVGIAADASTGTPANNVMLWHNVMVGQRLNRSYNDTGSTFEYRTAWSEVGEIRDQENIKSDTFTTPNAARIGNWANLYGVGRRSTVNVEGAGIGAAGSFQMEFGGLWSYNPTVTCGATNPCSSLTNTLTSGNGYFVYFKNRSAFDGSGTGTGDGDYHLLSNSPAINLVPSGGAVMPYDLDGIVRNNSGWGSAGVYEQSKSLTPVFW